MNPKMTTNLYKTLEVLYDNQLNIGDKRYCPLGQDEIATVLSCNKMTVNTALKKLENDGYIIAEGRKQYHLTDKGTDTVKKAKEIE